MQKSEVRKRKSGNTDLTKGGIYSTVIKFAFPIFISYLLQTFYGIADAAICGYTLTPAEVAGVNDTNSISFLFLQFVFGCTAGMSVIISNCVGKSDYAGARRSFATQIILGLAITAVITPVSVLCLNPLLKLLGVYNGGSEVGIAVYKAAYTYIFIICIGIAGQLFYNLICCVLRSVGDSLTPLVFLAVSTVLNIGLDLLFILAFKWGVVGAAVATVVSQFISAVGCFIFTLVKYPNLRPRKADFKAMTLRESLFTLWQGAPLGLQFSVLAFGVITMSNGVISFDKAVDGTMVGTPAQIGYSAACKLDNIFMTPLNALGTAMLSFCGQNHGAGYYDRIKKGIKCSIILMFAICAAVIAIGLLLTINGAYQHIFLASDKITPQSIKYGNVYLYTCLPSFPLLGALFVLRSAIQGLGKPLLPFCSGLAELVGRIAICLTLPVAVNGGPINASASVWSFFCLSLADPGAWLAADILLIIGIIIYLKPKRKNDELKHVNKQPLA